MSANPQPPQVRYIAAGTLGEPGVLRAIFNDPGLEVQKLTLQDYGLRIQPLEQIQQDFVRDDLRAGWNEKRQVPFYGAMTLVKAEGEQAQVSMVTVTPEQWKKGVELLRFWNYHDHAHKEEGWFHFNRITVNTPQGEVSGFAEILPEGTNLPAIAENYQSDPEYQRFITVMAEEIN